MFKKLFIAIALLAFFVSLSLTAVGGYADLLGRPLVISKQHAWNDGIFLMLIAIFFLLLSRL